MEWIADPDVWLSLVTLTALEIVLGIDNLIFIAVLVERLPEARRKLARRVGISMALITRLVLLSMTSLPRQGIAFAKVAGVTRLPTSLVGPFMDWDGHQVGYFRVYYLDGFLRARTGRGCKCLPPTSGEAFRPAVAAWAAGFKTGRDSGGVSAPPPGFEPFIN